MDINNPLETVYAPLGEFKTEPLWIVMILFLAYGFLLLFIQKVLFRFLKKWVSRRGSPWYDLVLQALERSIFLFLISGMVGVVPVIFRKIPKEWKTGVNLSAELLVVLAFALFLHALLQAAYRRYLVKQGLGGTPSGIMRGLISVVVFSIFLLIFLNTAGISITPLIASLGVGSVAVAFALQETLSSLFAGLYLVTDQPIRVGDMVKLESGQEGTVQSIGWRSTRIRLSLDNILIIPNSKLSNGIITNYSLPENALNLIIPLGVEYGSNLDLVEQVTLETAREVLDQLPGGVSTFEPSVRFDSFSETGIRFKVALRAKSFLDQPLLEHEFIKRLHKRYRQEGIMIPSPIQTVYLKKEIE